MVWYMSLLFNEYSKELFDYGVGINKRKEDCIKKLHKGMSKIIITVKKIINLGSV